MEGEETLTEGEIAEYLKSNAETSVGQRGYDYLCDWVAQNANRFNADSEDNKGEIYGVIEADNTGITWAYIIGTAFRAALGAVGMSDKAVTAWLDSNGYIKRGTQKSTYTIAKRIKGTVARCVAIKLPFNDDDSEIVDFDELI